MIAAYFKFEALSDELKQAHKIKSKARIDCIEHSYALAKPYQGLNPFQNKKGQIALYKTPAKEIIAANSKRLAEWSLNNGSLNLSSIYIEDFDFPSIGYGYPNAKPRLTNGEKNPLFDFRNDGYLFLMNPDITTMEMLIIENGRNLICSYYQLMIDGGLDEQLQKLRGLAAPYFIYNGLGL